MNIKRVASTVLFSMAGVGRLVTNNAVEASLFLFSETAFGTHFKELLEALLLLFPELQFLQRFAVESRLALIILAISRVVIYYIFLFIKRSFIEQGSLTLKYRPKSIIKNGMCAYFILVSLGVVFFISAVGIPVVIVLLIITCLFTLTGEASVSIATGNFIMRKFLKKKPRIETDLLIGAIILELLKLIPMLNAVLYVFVIPVVSLGIIVATAIGGYIKKIIYNSEYQENIIATGFNYIELRSIILDGAKEVDNDEEKRI